MIRNEQDRLLDEILADDATEQYRIASAVSTVAALRRIRRRRRVIRAGALVALPLALAGALIVALLPRPTPAPSRASYPSAPAHPEVVARGPGPVKVINDQELLALFPDRPVALIGPPGHQQLVFLDQRSHRGSVGGL